MRTNDEKTVVSLILFPIVPAHLRSVGGTALTGSTMPRMIAAVLLLVAASLLSSAAAPTAFIVGADISSVQAAEERGVKYSDRGVQKDILAILKDHGFNYVRLRVFNDP